MRRREEDMVCLEYSWHMKSLPLFGGCQYALQQGILMSVTKLLSPKPMHLENTKKKLNLNCALYNLLIGGYVMEPPTKKRKSNHEIKKAKAQKKKSRGAIDALPWKQVGLPDGLDDYEGFLGLEEIDGVDVVQNGTDGIVLAPKSSGESNTFSIEEEEWNGFEDSSISPPGQSNMPESKAPILKDSGRSETLADDGTNLAQGHKNPFEALDSSNSRETGVDIRSWRCFDLSEDILSSLSSLGFSEPTPIQAASLPHVLDDKDLIGKAPTGSGKTLAFGLPIVEKWFSRPKEKPTALIIEPTRELAHQIDQHLKALQHPSHSKDPQIATVTGGLSIQKQKRQLQAADIVIATPGRLWDIMEEDDSIQRRLQHIQVLVIDEADRLLSQGHFRELEQVITALDRRQENADEETEARQRQTLVFSATFAKELQQKLAKRTKLTNIGADPNSMGYLLQKLAFRQQPKFVDVNPGTQMAANLTEALLPVNDTNKDLYLYALLRLYQPHSSTRALVFVNSIAAVRRIVPFLQYLTFDAVPLHSSMEQKARLKSIERFTATGKADKNTNPHTPPLSSVLVATDVAARGLDLPEVHVVIHYHLPRTADMYVHRSGRTARASAHGASILMSGANEAAGVRRLVAQVHQDQYQANGKRHLQVLNIEDRILGQLRPRAHYAKQIADAEQAKEKASSTDRLMQQAADDLGVDLYGELEDFKDGRGKSGRGKKRKEKEAEARSISKAELKRMKLALKELLSQKINTGVSLRYPANGLIDMKALIAEQDRTGAPSGFLGEVRGLRLQMA